jgi:hypothetical protein
MSRDADYPLPDTSIQLAAIELHAKTGHYISTVLAASVTVSNKLPLMGLPVKAL